MSANLENSAVATGLAKVNFSFQSQSRAVPKNVQITVQLHSFHMLVGYAQNLQARFQQYTNRELLDVQAGFRKGRGIRYQIFSQYLLDHRESKGIPEKHLPVSLTAQKPLTV